MDGSVIFRRVAGGFNKAMVPALRTGLGRRLLGGSFAEVRYRGRKSGREFTFPVNYTRKGDEVRILVAVPSAKTWWRNFLGDGAPMHLRLGDAEHDAHAVATQDDRGRVQVRARLT